jgi:hypothetical protein
MSTRKSRVVPIGMAPAMKKSMQICISCSPADHQTSYCHTNLLLVGSIHFMPVIMDLWSWTTRKLGSWIWVSLGLWMYLLIPHSTKCLPIHRFRINSELEQARRSIPWKQYKKIHLLYDNSNHKLTLCYNKWLDFNFTVVAFSGIAASCKKFLNPSLFFYKLCIKEGILGSTH